MSNVRPLTPALDKRILDTGGELVGRVSELLFDAADGRIEYVCITMRKSGADKEVQAIIPWSAVVAPNGDSDLWRVLAPRTAIERIAKSVTIERVSRRLT